MDIYLATTSTTRSKETHLRVDYR